MGGGANVRRNDFLKRAQIIAIEPRKSTQHHLKTPPWINIAYMRWSIKIIKVLYHFLDLGNCGRWAENNVATW